MTATSSVDSSRPALTASSVATSASASTPIFGAVTWRIARETKRRRIGRGLTTSGKDAHLKEVGFLDRALIAIATHPAPSGSRTTSPAAALSCVDVEDDLGCIWVGSIYVSLQREDQSRPRSVAGGRLP